MKLSKMFLRGLLLAAAVGISAAVFSPSVKDAQGSVASAPSGGSALGAAAARTVIADTAASLALLATPVPGVKLDGTTMGEFAALATRPLGLGLVFSGGVDQSQMMGAYDLPSGTLTHEGLLRILSSETDCRWFVSGKTVYVTEEDRRHPVPQHVITSDVMDLLTALGQREAALRKAVDPDHLALSRNQSDGEGGYVAGIVDQCVERLEFAISDAIPELSWEGSGSVRIGPDGLLVARLRPQGHVQLESLLADMRAALKLAK